MSTADDIASAMAANAAGPKRIQVGDESVDQHSLPDQIAAEKHVRAKTAIDQPSGGKVLGFRFYKLSPPGLP